MIFFHISTFCVWVQVLGAEHPDTTSSYEWLAFVFNRQGQYDKALEYHGKALAIREKVGREWEMERERSKDDVVESRPGQTAGVMQWGQAG